MLFLLFVLIRTSCSLIIQMTMILHYQPYMIESNGRFVASIVVLHLRCKEDPFFLVRVGHLFSLWRWLPPIIFSDAKQLYHGVLLLLTRYRWISVYGNLFIAYYISFCSLAYHSGSLPIGATSFLEYTYTYEERILEDMPHGSSIVYSQGTLCTNILRILLLK